jgi:hypothetical protein
MSERKILSLGLVSALLVPVARLGSLAQNPPPRQHSQLDPSQVTLVDGAQHPELIPDSTAYRLYLLTVCTVPNPTDDERARQYSRLGMIRLQDKDRQQLNMILADFKSQYTSLISHY